MRRNEWIHFVFVAIAFVIAFVVYPQLPEQVASHWNMEGTVDGYISKFWGAFLMPAVILGMWLLFMILPRIDPRKKNYDAFRSQFDGFILMLVIFFLYVYVLTLLWNFDFRFDMTQAMVPALAILFYYIGMLLKSSKSNWFVGIRTPWTLSSDRVWAKTHDLASVLFKISALIALLGLLFPEYLFYLFFIPVVISAFVPLVYSYFIFKK